MRISHAEGIAPPRWLFLSDNVKGIHSQCRDTASRRDGADGGRPAEVEAAKRAGMDAIGVVRPGNAPLDADVERAHRVVDSFGGL